MPTPHTPTAGTYQPTTLGEHLIPRHYTRWVKQTAWAVAIANIVLIISGGVVRLTGSGLGCDAWPRCTSDGSWTTTPEMGIHGMVEFGNRLLTFVLVAVTVIAFLAVLRVVFPERVTLGRFIWGLLVGSRSESYRAQGVGAWLESRGFVAPRSRYSDLFNLTLLLLWGIPVQAVVGGISVWLRLNPWMITAHYMLSALMIMIAGIYLNRVYRYFEGTAAREGLVPAAAPAHAPTQSADAGAPASAHLMRVLGWVGVVLVVALMFMGTVTTGTGPHAGDAETHRHAFNPVWVTRLHGSLVWIYCASVLGFFALWRSKGWAPIFGKSLAFVLVVLGYQAIVGYTQYFNGLPIWLVEMHLIGSGVFALAASSLFERQLVLSSPAAREKAVGRVRAA
ncbi:COX15/CtaA family protein [Rothia nasimurium]|uniref:COX15/CtaA family protein n=1 Tax=Rothia nasimurium TaxID=85336 RepID=UPI001F390301|nr:cytochrome oxidase assembly protein [Rothia nasimurium]